MSGNTGHPFAISRADWQDEWSPEHPVQYRGSAEISYLSIEAAIARLSTDRDPDAVRQYLVNEGQPMPGLFGTYVLLTMDPSAVTA